MPLLKTLMYLALMTLLRVFAAGTARENGNSLRVTISGISIVSGQLQEEMCIWFGILQCYAF
jgi:hypothetical protein